VIGPRDTTPRARAVQLAAFRRLTSSERVAIACQLSDETRGLAADGVRYRHPEYSEKQVQQVVCRLLLGPELADRLRDPR